MKKSKIPFLIGTICSLLLLLFLYYNFYSNNSRINYLKNGGFKRTELPVTLSLRGEYDLNDGHYNVVGIVDGKLLIREYAKGNLISFPLDHTKAPINLSNVVNQTDNFSISINPFDKNIIDVQYNKNNKIFEFDIQKQKIKCTYEFTRYFYKAVRASKNSFYALIQSDTMNKASIVLVQFDTAGKMKIAKKSKLFIDAMSEDGTLLKVNSDLLYANYYNNHISTIDSALTTICSYKTIDTITVLPKTINIRNNTITKFINQPRPVNQLVRVTKELLFINSYVKSDNDIKNNLKNMETFDVYEIKNKYKYRGTIYLKKYDDHRVQDFLVQDKKLILQYPNKTLSYEFSL